MITEQILNETPTDFLNYRNPNKLIEDVCDFFSMSKDEVLSKSRKGKHVITRQTCMYLLRKKTNLSYHDIGEKLNRDHTTAMVAEKEIKYKLKTNSDYKHYFEQFEKRTSVKITSEVLEAANNFSIPTSHVQHMFPLKEIQKRPDPIYSNHSPFQIAN